MTTIYDKILLGQEITEKQNKPLLQKQLGIIYARVSDTKQIKEGHWLDSQQRACHEFAQKQQIPIKNVFTDEAISWRKLERQGIFQAIEYIKQSQKTAEPITHLFTTESSRISRSKNLYDTLDLERQIQEYGAKIIFVNMSALNNDDSWSQLLKTVSYYAASQESERISERTITWMKNRILEGYRPFQRPLGYKSFKTTLASWKENIFMDRDEPTASILADGLEKFASWELFTKAQFLNFLRDSWVRTAVATKKGVWLIDSIVEKILNPQRLIVYAWYISSPKRWITELIPWKHTPLISLETARQILKRLNNKDQKDVIIRKDYKEETPLRWLIYCSECDKKMTWWLSKGKMWKYYPYYHCCNRKCSQKWKSISARKMHEDIKNALFEWNSDEHIDKLFDYIFDDILQSNYKLLQSANKEKEIEIKNIEKEIDSIMDKILTLTNQDILKKLEDRVLDLSKKKDQLNKELEEKEDQTFDIKTLYDSTKFLFHNADRIRDIEDLDLRYILVWVRYNGKILYKKNQGVLNSDFSLSNLLYDVVCSNFIQWGGWRGSNPRQAESQSATLPAELQPPFLF